MRRRARIPRARQPNAIRLSYSKALLGYLAHAKDLVDRELVPMLPKLVAGAALVHDKVGDPNYVDELNRKIEEISSKFFATFPQERLRKLAQAYGYRTSDFQAAELRRQMKAALGKSIGIDVFADKGMPARIDAFAARNAALIKTIPSQFFDQISTRTVEALRKGERAEDVEDEIRDRYGVSQSRARLIARDQIGKLYGEVNSARQQDLGIDSFTWTTSHDERVRDEHVALDGQTFKWTEPPSEGIPGDPINCRCTGEPVFDSILAESQGLEPDVVPRKPRAPKEAPAPAEPTVRAATDFVREYSHLGDADSIAAEGRAALETGLDSTVQEVLDSPHWPPGEELERLRSTLGLELEKSKTLREIVATHEKRAAALGPQITERRVASAKAAAAVHGHSKRVALAGGGMDPKPVFNGSGPSTLRKGSDGHTIASDFSGFMGKMFRPNDRVREELEARGTPVNWIPTYKSQRAFYDPRTREISLPSSTSVGPNQLFSYVERAKDKFTLGHEFGHYLEDLSPDALSRAVAFREARTKGEQLQSLAGLTGGGYDSWEMAKPDKFVDPYIGKSYKIGLVDTGTEVTSMGIENVFHSPSDFFRKDPEHFLFTLGQLAKWRKP